ncbi:MAG TPA: SDR family oxidoreductase [Rhodanobacteraceae bacterium]|nr:SDR family oxidoreductase [Rhodanobacteraceae bacterium]
MNLDLAGKHALVCGASQGIGRATAIELAALGARVTVMARRADALAKLAAELPVVTSGPHDALVADAADTGALEAAVRKLVANAPVDILVNNSGGPPPGAVADAPLAAFDAALRAHLYANHVLAGLVVPHMRARGWGRIVNVISTSVKEPIPGIGVSNTTRGAVASWSKTLSRELAPAGITVNNVLPGSTDTPRIAEIVAARAAKTGHSEADVRAEMFAEVPAGRFAAPAEVAAAIAFLCAPAAAYITGVNLPVDGGRMRSI